MTLELFDRVLAAYTMAVHVLFTFWAIGLPIYIVAAEYLAYRKNDPYYMAIAKRWATVMAVLFAVGSAAGAAIAVEFITAWYKWMYVVNQVEIIPFDIEVLAFFLEVFMLALYLYGWDRLSPNAHMALGLGISLGSISSAILIIIVNSWMNTPVGLNIDALHSQGVITDVNPLAGLWPPVATAEVPMGVFGALFTAFTMVASYMALRKLLKKNMTPEEKEYYSRGFRLAVYLAALDAIGLAWAGDNAGKTMYYVQPLKLATLEGLMQSYPNGGAPMDFFGAQIPGLLSLLVSWPPNPNAPVLGYSSFDQQVWDPIWWLAHDAYDVHATLGIIGAIVVWILALSLWKKPKSLSFLGLDDPENKKLPLAVMWWMGWLELVAWEAGWVAAETGRQPFVIWGPMVQTSAGLYTIEYGMLTSEAYDNSPYVLPIGVGIMVTLFIAVLGTVLFLRKLFANRPVAADLSVPVTVSSGGAPSMAVNPNPSPSVAQAAKQTTGEGLNKS